VLNNIGKKVNKVVPSISTVTLLAEWETVLGHLEKGNAKRPDIRGDGVGEPLDSLGLNKTISTFDTSRISTRQTYSHVVRSADKGIRVPLGSNKFSGNTKIAQFHLSISAQ